VNEPINLSEKHNKRKNFWLSILILVYYLVDLYLRTSYSEQLFLFWSGLGYLGVAYVLFRKKVKFKYVYLLLILLSCMLMSSIFNNNMQLPGIFFNLQYLGIAFILNESKLNVKVISLLIYINFVFFLYHIFIGTNPNTVFLASRNHISTVLINIIVIYYITLERNTKKLKVLPVFFALIISIWSVSRSAIVSIIIFFVGLVYLKLLQNKKHKIDSKHNKSWANIFYKTTIALSSIGGAVYLFKNTYIVQTVIDGIINNFKVFQLRLQYESYLSSSRLQIIQSYVYEIADSFKNLIFGVELSSTQSFALFSNNLHSSFLTAHAYYGLFGLLLILGLIFFTLIRYLKKRKWLFLLLFVTVLVRASTDIIAFPGYLDSILYFFILDASSADRLKSKTIVGQKDRHIYKYGG